MKNARDLDLLPQREDFKTLLAELEAKYPEPPAKPDAKEERLQRLRLAVCIVAGWPFAR